MKNLPKLFTAVISLCLVFSLFVSPILAAAPDGAGPWADSVVSSVQGLRKDGSAVPAVRSDPTSALGVAENNTTDGNFYSLGFGGVITLGFVNGISSGVLVIEATNPGYPGETAKVEVSSDGVTYVTAGNVTADGDVNVPAGVSCAKYVRITDTSNVNNFSDGTADAYDVDGVQAKGEACTPTPSPTPGGSCGCGGSTVIKQTNNTTVINGITSNANTGNNTSAFNTGGTSNITTGGASNTTNVTVIAGSNTANVGGGGCCAGGVNAAIIGNGAGSVNTIKINSKKKAAPSRVLWP